MHFQICLVFLLVSCLNLSVTNGQVPATGTPWGAIAGLVIQRLGSLFDEGAFDLFGHSCNYKVEPSFAHFKMTYKGKAWCPTWTSHTGKSRTKSKNGAIEHALSDLINKLKTSGSVTDAEANTFLQKYHG